MDSLTNWPWLVKLFIVHYCSHMICCLFDLLPSINFLENSNYNHIRTQNVSLSLNFLFLIIPYLQFHDYNSFFESNNGFSYNREIWATRTSNLIKLVWYGCLFFIHAHSHKIARCSLLVARCQLSSIVAYTLECNKRRCHGTTGALVICTCRPRLCSDSNRSRLSQNLRKWRNERN